MSEKILTIPDLGGVSEAEVIEILVECGEAIAAEQAILVLESDKASMEVPIETAGTLSSLSIKLGDKVKQGDEIGVLQLADSGQAAPTAEPRSSEQTPTKNTGEVKSAPAKPQAQQIIKCNVPDLGGVASAEVIEVLIAQGDEVSEEQVLLVLESDKASMELPAEHAGKVTDFSVKVGDKLKAGDYLISIETNSQQTGKVTETNATPEPKKAPTKQAKNTNNTPEKVSTEQSLSDIEYRKNKVHAGPAVRKLAREFGVNLTEVEASGPKQRIVKEDIQKFVKNRVKGSPVTAGTGIPTPPVIDFSQFGEIKQVPLNNIKKATAKAMTTAWLNVPQVTQFDHADISELEDFRKQQNVLYAKQDIKFTLVPFVLKALSKCLQDYPEFNASLSEDAEHLIMKEYINIGVAVDTPKGLLVPVIKDLKHASVSEINAQVNAKAELARLGKLPLADMQGGCMSLSSLGGIGGNAFTPIVNPPEVAILGLSRASMQPVWNGKEFTPRLMLPLSLSYDHRVIDGAQAARFARTLASYLEDMRALIM